MVEVQTEELKHMGIHKIQLQGLKRHKLKKNKTNSFKDKQNNR